MTYHFRNLVMEGGGVKGIAYLGAMEVLENKGILQQVKRIGGTSAGAINAILLGLNYNAREMKEILWQMDFRKFEDDSFGFGMDFLRLVRDYGWYKGKYFREWIAELIGRKTGNPEATFADIKNSGQFRELFFVGTNITTRFSVVFSYENTPLMPVAEAIRISMSIPLLFAAKKFNGDVYVDGAVLDNYPVKLFDRVKYLDNPLSSRETEYYAANNQKITGDNGKRFVYNKETLGFRLDSRREIDTFAGGQPKQHDIKNFFSYSWALIDTLMESQESAHLHSDDWQRTVYIDTLGIKTTQFDISDEQKEKLIDSGRTCALEYFKWFDNDPNAVNKL